MDQELASYNLFNLHLHDATLDEHDSFNYLRYHLLNKPTNYFYKYPEISFDAIGILVSNFALFFARIKDAKSGDSFAFNVPINVFRFMLTADGNWSEYYTIKRKPGYVVEGMYWSNGMFYQVREDKKDDFEIYEVTLSIDSLTKTSHLFPNPEDLQ